MLDTLLFKPSVSLLKDRYVPADAAMLPTPKAATTFVKSKTHVSKRVSTNIP